MSGIKTGSPLLAINIPIYNRKAYLERMLSRFLEDQDLFEEKISLYISDNCSEDSLVDIVQSFREKGLRVEYHRYEQNVGGDRNIISCFRRGGGRYVWVLGSDDIPRSGVVREIVRILEEGPDYGILHVTSQVGQIGYTEYDSADVFFETIHVWITFISGSIIRGCFIEKVPIEKYLVTSLAQIPLFLTAGFGGGRNAILSTKVFEDETEGAFNGGYNIFRVFCDNLLGLLKQSVKEGYLSQRSYFRIKKSIYRFFLTDYIITLLILKRESNFDISGAYRILLRNYGMHLYSYWLLACKLSHAAIKKLLRFFS